MPSPWRPPFDLLGMRAGGEAPARAALQIAPPDVVQAMGGGFVCSADTFTLGAVEPVPGGLYAEETFGPLPRTA